MLIKALATIMSRHSAPEAFHVLQAVLTAKEVDLVERRLRIAKLLQEDKSYKEIQKELSVSAATVAVVAEQLNHSTWKQLMNELDRELTRFHWFKK
jgi:uncharacterized protein YerC